ncbi:hypothetical protein [Chondrinema litorale]|nr:hypothetical protein [Chondrinema litorale]UZR93122.1 hypothetical protein OQ292_14775 [Chondrinema litorale]
MAKKLTFSLDVNNKEKAKVLEALIKAMTDDNEDSNFQQKKSS